MSSSISPDMHVRRVHISWLEAHVNKWHELEEKALEPNILFSPECVLPALRHLEGEKPPLLFVVECRKTGEWQGLAFFEPFSWCRPFILEAYRHLYSRELPFPLLHQERAAEAFHLLVSHIRHLYPTLLAIHIPYIPRHLVTKRWMKQLYTRYKRKSCVYATQYRAYLPAQEGISFYAQSKNLKKNIKKRIRRLEGMGEVRFVTLETSLEIEKATDVFLALEASGWKGEKGTKTALLCHPQHAAFFKACLSLCVQQGKCRIYGLWLGEKPLCLQVVLFSKRHAVTWKSAYEEAYAVYGPGQLLLEYTSREQEKIQGVEWTDSLTSPDNGLMNEAWPERLWVDHVLFATYTGNIGAILCYGMASYRRLYRKIRGYIKKLYYKIKKIDKE